MKKVYGIAETLLVCNEDDGNGLENDPEPVICIPLGVFLNRKSAEKIANNENKKSESERFVVCPIKVNP